MHLRLIWGSSREGWHWHVQSQAGNHVSRTESLALARAGHGMAHIPSAKPQFTPLLSGTDHHSASSGDCYED